MKRCCTCKENKELLEFNKNKCRKDGLNSICRVCSNKRSRKYYQDNLVNHRKVVRQRVLKVIKSNRTKISKLKESGCIICFEPNEEALDFHHLDPTTKRYSVSKTATMYYWSRVIQEITKCILVCANCHRKLTRKSIMLLPHIEAIKL